MGAQCTNLERAAPSNLDNKPVKSQQVGRGSSSSSSGGAALPRGASKDELSKNGSLSRRKSSCSSDAGEDAEEERFSPFSGRGFEEASDTSRRSSEKDCAPASRQPSASGQPSSDQREDADGGQQPARSSVASVGSDEGQEAGKPRRKGYGGPLPSANSKAKIKANGDRPPSGKPPLTPETKRLSRQNSLTRQNSTSSASGSKKRPSKKKEVKIYFEKLGAGADNSTSLNSLEFSGSLGEDAQSDGED